MSERRSPFSAPLEPTSANRPSLNLPVKQQRSVGLRRIVLSQPPHYGRIGAQADHTRANPEQWAADRAISEAQFARQHKTTRRGSRAVVG